jgi:hypothetical protein
MLKNVHLTYSLVKKLDVLHSELLDQDQLDIFYNLKSNVEGWKKGNLLKVSGQKHKTTTEMTTENLRLYVNQLTNSNYNTIREKIVTELDNDTSRSILINLVLDDAIKQTNNLQLLSKLVCDLNMYESLLSTISEKLDKNINVSVRNDYDQFCIDNMNNLIFKNRFVLLSFFYKSHDLDMNKYLDILVKGIDTLDKIQNEIYVLTLVELLKAINEPEKFANYYTYIKNLTESKLITTKSVVTILNLID